MTRIPYCTTMSAQASHLTEERGNLNVYRALAHAGEVFTGWMLAGRDALTSPVLPAQLRELVILRIGYLMNAPYEIAQHTSVAEKAGVSARKRSALNDPVLPSSAGFDETQRSVLELTTELVSTKTVAAEHLTAVREQLGDEALIEILLVISRWSGLALMLNALDVDLDTDAHFALPH